MRYTYSIPAIVLALALGATAARTQQPEVRTSFRIKYVANGSVYIDGGHSSGLAEGLKLEVKHTGTSTLESGTATVKAVRTVAQLVVSSVAETSAVCDIVSSVEDLQVGDIASLSADDARALVERQASASTRHYPQVITFTEGDPLDEEVRESVPRPPLPEINRRRGRIGIEYSGLSSGGPAASHSTQIGIVMRGDMTRINGTYWNFSGYWRMRTSSRSSAMQQTLNDLVSRTYHLEVTYVNPNSRWVAGFGRLFIPWASSLSTIDGGYFGRKIGQGTTLGMFAGSTPDPSSWNYNPDRRIAGTFISFEGGSFEGVRYSSTMGAAVSSIRWRLERPFIFFENNLSFHNKVSIYQSLEADKPRSTVPGMKTTPGVSRSFVTLRVQATPRVSFDISHNYFRDYPTFDPQLIGTGLVDKLLFQGLNGGMRVELPRHISVYTTIGRSTRTGDTKSSWNQMYGITFGNIKWTGIRADLRYSKFDSSFGKGNYRALSLSRQFGDNLRLEVQTGQQHFVSPLTKQSGGHFVSSIFEWSLGAHYFLGAGYTMQRGQVQNYNQWYFNWGYRF